MKGEGKTGNYGVAIRPPAAVDIQDLPAALQSASSASMHSHVAVPPDAEIPVPIAATTEDVEEWMRTSFKKLTNISTKVPPEVGESVLWRGVKTGRHGCPSTKCEYFNGKVRFLQVEEDGELYLYVD